MGEAAFPDYGTHTAGIPEPRHMRTVSRFYAPLPALGTRPAFLSPPFLFSLFGKWLWHGWHVSLLTPAERRDARFRAPRSRCLPPVNTI
jgi:hypothetical protein